MQNQKPNQTCVDAGAKIPDHKKWCGVCKLVVVSFEHDRRCKVLVDSSTHSRMRRLAWLGDARHTFDVRAVLLSANVPDDRLQGLAVEYISKDAQATWYNSYEGLKDRSLGDSKHSIATAFEASYHGQLRRDYLLWLVAQFQLNGFDSAYAVYF